MRNSLRYCSLLLVTLLVCVSLGPNTLADDAQTHVPLPVVTMSGKNDVAAEHGCRQGTVIIARDTTTGPLTVRYTTAATLIRVTGIVASSSYNANYTPEKAYDGNTITQWMSAGNSDHEGKDDTPSITYTFDKVYQVGLMRICNASGCGHAYRGMKDVEILVSTNGVTFTPIGIKRLKQGPPEPGQWFYEDIDLGGVEARRITLKVKTNWYDKVFGEGKSYEGAYANASIVCLGEAIFYTGGSASQADYYETLTGSVTIPDGQASGILVITPVKDMEIEGEEMLSLALLPDSAYVIGMSYSVNITIIDDKDRNFPPTASITAPVKGVTFAAPVSVITITATATDRLGAVSKVEFYQGAKKLGEDTTAPYSFDWKDVAAGNYKLTVRAVDDAGDVTISAPVRISVK